MPNEPVLPERYASMDLAAAQRECSTPTNKENIVTRDGNDSLKCPRCKRPVFLHCSNCKIQITGCLCTEIDRFGQDEAWKRAVERYGQEVARQHYANMGLWVPPEFRLGE